MAVECELSAVHSVLSHLIDEHLPVEILIAKAVHSFKCCPPVTLATRHKLDIDKRLVDRQIMMTCIVVKRFVRQRDTCMQ